MKNSFGQSAILLTAIGIVAKLIGALYRVPLTNIVGAEGMGLYQMVFPLYTVLLAFCGGGVTGAVSRVVAKYTAKGDEVSASRTVRIAIVSLLPVAAISTVAVALLRNTISGLQGNRDAGIAYLALCPSLLFACGIGALRGYFQGKNLMLPSGVSQLVEQSIKLALGLYLSGLFLPRGVPYAVAGALTGVTVSEAVALVYLCVRYLLHRKKRMRRIVGRAAAEFATDNAIVTDGVLIKELYSFALPVTLGSLVIPITQMIDSVLVINLLMHGGAGRAEATALFGLFVGPVGTLINMPAVVIVSVSVAFLPALTAAIERGDVPGAQRATKSAVRWILLFVLPVTAAFMLFPERIVLALYSKGLTSAQLAMAARLLRIQAVSVFYVGILQFATTVMQAHNKSHRPVINLVIGACVKVGLTPLLVRFVGIIGAAFATAACYAVAATLTLRAAYKQAGICASIKSALIVPLAFCAAACVTFFLTAYALSFSAVGEVWQTVIAGGAFAAVYSLIFILPGKPFSRILSKKKA